MKNYFFLFPSLFICLSFSNFHLVARLTSFDQQKQLLQKNILEESKHRFNLKGNYVANDFYVTNFSDSVVGDHFFIINFVLTGNMFNYLRSVTRQTTSLAPNEFISSFIEGYISLKTLQESWKPACDKMHKILKEEAKKYPDQPDFIKELCIWIVQDWAHFKDIFNGRDDEYSNFSKSISFPERETMLRMNGGTLQIPILHGLLPESPQAAHLEGWRIGQAARMTANIPQTVSLLKYFYESNIKFTAQKRVYYEVTGPKIRVKFTDNKKEVYYHIPYLLQRIKETFHFKESEMKNIQIAPQDYFVNIEAVPKNDVHFNVLDVNNPTIIYKTKTVQFYGA